MRFLTPSECVKWCEMHDYPAGPHEGYLTPIADETPAGFHFADFSIPTDSGRKVALARLLYSLIDPAPELLLWLGEWGVWKYCEHIPLLTRFREALGESRPLIDAPGQLVTMSEAEDGISILVVALEFCWDCHIISGAGNEAVFVSHDEFGWYGSRDASRTESVDQRLQEALRARKHNRQGRGN